VQASHHESGMLCQPSQPQTMRERDMNDMAKHGEEMNEERKSARSRDHFIKLSGIGLELAEFVTEFIEKPEIFYSMPFEKRRQIENQMDEVLSSFGRLC
jgi:hypothetical protein